MKWFWISAAVVLIVFGGGYFLLQNSSSSQQFSVVPTNSIVMKLTSSAFAHNQRIPVKYTCDGDDVSPPLTVSGIPQGTAELALVMHDPDAPREGGWTHWILWNIDPQITHIDEGTVPDGAMQGTASSGNVGYEGPCPPSGTHHYNFTLYALSERLALPEETTKDELEEAMSGKIIATSGLTGLYSREE